MGKNPNSYPKEGWKKGGWTADEDNILTNYVNLHGERKWPQISKQTDLRRCGKSCRLRWMNYLNPNIKRGNITLDEEDLILRLHKLLGNRWTLIAGRLPGRTDNEIKNYWNCVLSKKVRTCSVKDEEEIKIVHKPKPFKISGNPESSKTSSAVVEEISPLELAMVEEKSSPEGTMMESTDQIGMDGSQDDMDLDFGFLAAWLESPDQEWFL